MNLSQLKSEFDNQGFVVVRNFLPPEMLAELRSQLDRYIGEVVPTLPDWHAFYEDRARPETLKQMQHMEGDPFFREYVGNARWKSLAEALVGETAACESPEWFNKPPGTQHPTPPHQDNYYFNLTPSNVVTIWVALDPVDDENGCLRYVPGSHRKGFRQHARSRVLGFSQGISDYGPEDTAGEQRIHLQPGDATAHHGMTIHRADPNGSANRNRRAFAMVFKGVSCRRDEEGFKRYEASYREQHTELGLQTPT
ncbi:MAG: phytanoyl-CoA dioxygenase family protein [Planctomycetota bacterium]|nr:phytanoyl-CoA dioxygenase family protein [Planctomycetota bacterium]